MGEIAIVTGGARGIGRGVARTLARAGIDVVIGDLLDLPEIEKEALETVAQVEALGRRAEAVRCDVKNPDDLSNLVAVAIRDFGGLDFVCCNAGVLGSGKAHELSLDEWDRIMSVNATGTFLTYQAVAPYLIEQRAGSIVNIASSTGLRGARNMAHYSASKFAVVGFTQSVAAEVARHGVRVNCVCPSSVPTEMSLGPFARGRGISREAADEEWAELMTKRLPLGVSPTADAIGEAVLYLFRAESVTGVALPVTAGDHLS